MPSVQLQRSLTVPAIPARSAASEIMHEIAERRPPWAEFALYLNFGSIGLPDVGYVAIPVAITDLTETTEPRHEIRFKLRARRSPDAFPSFDGALGIDVSGPSSATLWFAGEYELPLRQLGALFDGLFEHGAAEKSLRNMLNELADAIVARVEKRELALVRYRLIFDTGD
ncbi:MAG: hypothetical protein ACXWNJ_15085 [Vulcanimicrobiaceae bacterium]